MDGTEDNDTAVVGEVCHIVAASQDGPRGTHPLDVTERDGYENLILLCSNHHILVDSQPGKYTVDRLRRMKADHENWVRTLLGGSTTLSSRNCVGAQEMEDIRILHLSDLHFGPGDDWCTLLQPLVLDLQSMDVRKLDYVVFSGDISQSAGEAEYAPAVSFTSRLLQEFGVPANRLMVVPGNHDVDWSADVYRAYRSREIDPTRLAPGTFQEFSARSGKVIYMVREQDEYLRRFRNFSEYYLRPLVGRGFWIHPTEQAQSSWYEGDGIAFIMLNSSWETDEFFQERASIHPHAVTQAVAQLNANLSNTRHSPGYKPLIIGVWHHSVTGGGSIGPPDCLERLAQAGVRLSLTGHVHEHQVGCFHQYRPPLMHIIGAGTFGAQWKDRTPNVPKQYNLLEVARDHSRVRVHTRARPLEGGAWGGDYCWGNPRSRQPYYDIVLT